MYLISQGDEIGCADLRNDLAVQGAQPVPELYDALLRFASQRNDTQAIDALLIDKAQSGAMPTLDDFRLLLAESDAWVRPAPPIVTELVYMPPPPYIPYPPLDTLPTSESTSSTSGSTPSTSESTPPISEFTTPMYESTIPISQCTSANRPEIELRELIVQKDFAGAHELLRAQRGPTTFLKGLYETLLLEAARERNAQMCLELLDEFAHREVNQYSADTISAEVRCEVMEALSKRGEWNGVLRVLHEMRARGLTPDTRAYVTAALGLRYATQTNRSLRFLQCVRDDGVRISPVMYTAILVSGMI